MGGPAPSPVRPELDEKRHAAGRGVVVLSTADWDATTWTNKQHTSRALRDAGFSVLYVESMGLRAPRM